MWTYWILNSCLRGVEIMSSSRSLLSKGTYISISYVDNSLISLPCLMSHASIPAKIRAARGLNEDLIRISAGIEHPDDLIQDLARVMDQIYNSKDSSSEAST